MKKSRPEMALTRTLLVGGRGFEPLTPSASRKCSPPELTARGRVIVATGCSDPCVVARYSVAMASSTSNRDARHAGSTAAMTPAIIDATRNSTTSMAGTRNTLNP
jgi:hypothetical protein